jgi:hypothetical protein
MRDSLEKKNYIYIFFKNKTQWYFKNFDKI